jgi:putative ABC transport system substrate-binding protein
MNVREQQMTFTIPRRKFITLLSTAAVAWPHAADAQQKKLLRIGALVLGNADAESFRTELREGLRSAGYIEGQNVLFDFRSADGKLARLPELAAELVALKVDVIVAVYTPCAFAAQRATSEIPIVILAGNPVETGLVGSLARPGRNITGMSLMAAELNGKCVELFRDMLPSVRRGLGEIDAAFAAIKNDEARAVVVQGSLSTKNVAELALRHRLPAATVPRSFAEVGGLMSYSYAESDALRRSAFFVIKILQGGKPADMPVEQPSKFELAINLKTAKALDLNIAETFLLRADRLID